MRKRMSARPREVVKWSSSLTAVRKYISRQPRRLPEQCTAEPGHRSLGRGQLRHQMRNGQHPVFRRTSRRWATLRCQCPDCPQGSACPGHKDAPQLFQEGRGVHQQPGMTTDWLLGRWCNGGRRSVGPSLGVGRRGECFRSQGNRCLHRASVSDDPAKERREIIKIKCWGGGSWN